MKLKKIGTCNLILIILAVFLLAFTAIMIRTYNCTGGIPDTLCTCVFSFCCGEYGIMGWIKTTKDKQSGATTNQQEIGSDESVG